MARKRRVFESAFKAKVAPGSRAWRSDDGAVSVHASQVTAWKKQLLAQAAELFEDGRRRGDEDRSA